MHADELRITSPCTLDIEDIAARNRGRRRFCEHCTKDVLVISAMTEAEAREALATHAGKEVCLSYSVNEDGQVIHRDESAPQMPARGPNLVPSNLVPSGRLGRRRRAPAPLPRRLSALAASVAALSLAALTACAPEAATPESQAAPADAMVLAVDEPSTTLTAEDPTIPLQPTELGDSPCDGVETELMDQPPVDAKPQTDSKPEPTKKIRHRAGGKRPTVRPPQPVMAGGMALPDDL